MDAANASLAILFAGTESKQLPRYWIFGANWGNDERFAWIYHVDIRKQGDHASIGTSSVHPRSNHSWLQCESTIPEI